VKKGPGGVAVEVEDSVPPHRLGKYFRPVKSLFDR
jgi:hypothetical protein